MTHPTTGDSRAFLSRIIGALDQAGIEHMLAGSFASSMHGTPRATHDIDLVINTTPESLDRLLEILAKEEMYVAPDVARAELRRGGQFNVVDQETAWKADLIYRKSRPFSRAEFARRTSMSLLGLHVSVATAEDTVLAKLEWAKLGHSELQLADVRGILDVRAGELDRAYIESWLDALGVRHLWEIAQQL